MHIKSTQLRKFIFRLICGFFLGISVIAPGVSGSVLAVMLGIYPELIRIVSAPFKNFKHNVLYLIPMGIGAVISLALFVLVFSFLFDNYPLQTVVLFIGLIVGGIPSIFKQATSGAFKTRYIVGAVLAFLPAALMSQFTGSASAAAAAVPFAFLCISGFIGGIVGIIPGVSVSIVLMLLGVYEYLLHSAAMFTSDLLATASVIIPFGVCFVLGLILFSRVVRFVFERYPNFAYYLVLGFMFGTIFSVFPRTFPPTAGALVGCILALIAGLAVSFLFEQLGKRFNPEEETAQ